MNNTVTDTTSHLSDLRGGLLIGILIGIFLVAVMVIFITGKGNGFKPKYDERQQLIIGRGYKIGFYTALGLTMVLFFLGLADVQLSASKDVLYFTAVMIGLAVEAIYCIVNDGYVALNQNRTRVIIVMLAAIVLNANIGIFNIMNGNSDRLGAC